MDFKNDFCLMVKIANRNLIKTKWLDAEQRNVISLEQDGGKNLLG
jgi:hypothetical protein